MFLFRWCLCFWLLQFSWFVAEAEIFTDSQQQTIKANMTHLCSSKCVPEQKHTLWYIEERSLCSPVAPPDRPLLHQPPPLLEAQLQEAPANHMLSQLGLPASNRDTLTLIRSAGEVLSLVRRHDSANTETPPPPDWQSRLSVPSLLSRSHFSPFPCSSHRCFQPPLLRCCLFSERVSLPPQSFCQY